jgi:hypothetical protein
MAYGVLPSVGARFKPRKITVDQEIQTSETKIKGDGPSAATKANTGSVVDRAVGKTKSDAKETEKRPSLAEKMGLI